MNSRAAIAGKLVACRGRQMRENAENYVEGAVMTRETNVVVL